MILNLHKILLFAQISTPMGILGTMIICLKKNSVWLNVPSRCFSKRSTQGRANEIIWDLKELKHFLWTLLLTSHEKWYGFFFFENCITCKKIKSKKWNYMICTLLLLFLIVLSLIFQWTLYWVHHEFKGRKILFLWLLIDFSKWFILFFIKRLVMFAI